MKFKKIHILLGIILSTTLLLTACGDKNKESTNANNLSDKGKQIAKTIVTGTEQKIKKIEEEPEMESNNFIKNEEEMRKEYLNKIDIIEKELEKDSKVDINKINDILINGLIIVDDKKTQKKISKILEYKKKVYTKKILNSINNSKLVSTLKNKLKKIYINQIKEINIGNEYLLDDYISSIDYVLKRVSASDEFYINNTKKLYSNFLKKEKEILKNNNIQKIIDTLENINTKDLFVKEKTIKIDKDELAKKIKNLKTDYKQKYISLKEQLANTDIKQNKTVSLSKEDVDTIIENIRKEKKLVINKLAVTNYKDIPTSEVLYNHNGKYLNITDILLAKYIFDTLNIAKVQFTTTNLNEYYLNVDTQLLQEIYNFKILLSILKNKKATENLIKIIINTSEDSLEQSLYSLLNNNYTYTTTNIKDTSKINIITNIFSSSSNIFSELNSNDTNYMIGGNDIPEK